MIIIIMGIAGSGKSTIGKLLAENLQWPFYDADVFHSEDNINKMREDLPLNDKDRIPWLEMIRDLMVEWDNKGNAVLACSALKESYRQILNEKVSDVKWVILMGSRDMIKHRITVREGHFMKGTLMESQIKDFEKPDYGLTVSVTDTPEHIVQKIRTSFKI